MANKKKAALPKNFDELVKAGDIAALKAVFDSCELDACGGYSKMPALSFRGIPKELVRWLVEQGADINVKDQFGNTPLHNQASYFNHDLLGLMIDLGADIEAKNNSGETPLFSAVDKYNITSVNTLLARGANIHAKNKRGHAPLYFALVRCQNAHIESMTELTGVFLAAGEKITPEMRKEVERIGKNFEFHRERFNKEMLPSTELALSRLYKIFGATPAAKRRVHDGVSLITVTAKGWWGDQHEELWEYLVPSNGCAKTVQGEVIRVTGRISSGILDNGSVNWYAELQALMCSIMHHGIGKTCHGII